MLKRNEQSCPFILPHIFFHLGGSSHNSSSPSHLLQVLQGNTEAFPSPLRDAVSGGTCHEEDSQDSQVLWNFHLCLFSAYSLEDEHRTKLWLSSQTDSQFTRFPSQIQTWRKGQKSCCWYLFLFSLSFFSLFFSQLESSSEIENDGCCLLFFDGFPTLQAWINERQMCLISQSSRCSKMVGFSNRDHLHWLAVNIDCCRLGL